MIQFVPLLGLLAAALSCAPPPPPPNVLLITIDTLRADHSSTYGYHRDTTPTLDALANSGARFETTYAPMSLTGPVHASIFSGLYPSTHLLLDNGLEMTREYDTLADLFGAAGYQTAAVVSSFVLSAKFGFARGFGLKRWFLPRIARPCERSATRTEEKPIQPRSPVGKSDLVLRSRR